MTTLSFEFPARRYHATPWGQHVNEGAVEWPPSPWRLLRALLATGYNALGWTDPPPPEADALVDALAARLPSYHLPVASGAHSRHYMPLGVLDKGREKTSLVFDTWAHISEGPLLVQWAVQLDAAQRDLLGRLVSVIGYLGRSESWVIGRLEGGGVGARMGMNCVPCEDGMLGDGWEQVSLIAPRAAEEYAGWRAKAVAELPPNEHAAFPAGLRECLETTTSQLRREGWAQPPGSRKVLYWRRRDALEGWVGAAVPPAPRYPVEAVLLAVATVTRNLHALPSVTRTLPQAELLHRALVSASTQGGHSGVLSGCDATGIPLRSGHVHVHVLPLDLDADGHIEHILLWAPMGLDGAAQAAVESVRWTFTKGGGGPLQLAIVGRGSLADLTRVPRPMGARLSRIVSVGEGVRRWVSMTPFVPPRHAKSRGANTLQGQVLAELRARGIDARCEVKILDTRDIDKGDRLRHFVRVRRFGPAPPVDAGFAIALEFAEPQRGPISLGYGSHFGLGLFVAESG